MQSADFTWIISNTAWFGKRHWNHIPYAEAILAAVLRREGYTVNAIDANVDNLSASELEAKVAEFDPKVVAIGTLSIEYKLAAHEAFRIVKKVNPKIITILGGVYPTLSPEVAIKDPNVDYVILGEGEERLPLLLRAIKSGASLSNFDGVAYRVNGQSVINRNTGTGIENLDALPFPDYSDFDMYRLTRWGQKFTQNNQFRQFPMSMSMTSRGCPYQCTYCAAGKDMNPINGGTRTRSPQNVLDEVDMLREKYGVREMIFVDDSLLLPRKRAIDIMKGLAERRKNGSDLLWKSNNLDIRHVTEEILDWMKESGCYQLTFSLESGSPNTLKRMNRNYNIPKAIKIMEAMKEKGFEEVCSNFIVGFPGDTWDDIRETFNFADDLRRKGILDYALFSVATPLPGTELAEQAAAGGYLPDDFDPTQFYGFGKGLITTSEFTPDELHILRAYEWDRINFKTEDDKVKIAKMLGITIEELDIWRKETRKQVGVQVKSADTVIGYAMATETVLSSDRGPSFLEDRRPPSGGHAHGDHGDQLIQIEKRRPQPTASA
jgi:radical SAM superfamily enzyme YgiQ (UPF0313 family)